MGVYQSIINRAERTLSSLFPGFYSGSTKHDHYKDYGWPDQPSFEQFHRMYCRNGLASAAVDKTVAKTWETAPALWETEKPTDTTLERAIRKRFAQLRVWQNLANVDRRGMVGAYAGAILLLGDGKKLEEPVDRVPGGINGLAGIIPAWEGQLKVVEWDTREDSETYGLPRFYQFDEAAVGDPSNVSRRQIRIHPDRVLIWSEDGTVNGYSMLEPGYNDLIDAEKVKGAGGEGFWKSARGAPVIEAPQGMSMQDVLKGLGAETSAEAIQKINDQIDDFQQGFDKGLMLGGMTAKPMQIALPQPKEFFNIAVQSFAASMQIPIRILLGNETGERASTEDAREWAQTNMGRRETIVLPALDEFVRRLVQWGILPAKEWVIGWASLLDVTPDQQLDRAAKMSTINAQTLPGDDPAFLPNEIREAAGFEAIAGGDEHGEPEDTQTEADDGTDEDLP
jgi:hypothetical protein